MGKPPIDAKFLESMASKIETARKTIKAVETVKALQDCVDGLREMSKEQIAAAKILLGKVMPDLKAVEHSGFIERRTANELTREQLMDIAARGSAGAVETGSGDSGSSGFH